MRATKFILGYSNSSPIYKDRLLKQELIPITYWHELKDLVFYFKMNNCSHNIDIYNFIKPKVLVRSTRNSCSLDFEVPKCKTSLFQKSSFVRTCETLEQ